MQDQLIKIRVCKNCNLVKNLEEFPKNRKKMKIISRIDTCVISAAKK